MANIQQTSSGSDSTDARYAMMDEKKRKRMISNRESARRSRLKKQKQMEDMIHEISTLQRKIQQGNEKCKLLNEGLSTVESENNFLRTEKIRLANYMNNLEMMVMNLTQNEDQIPETSIGDCRTPRQFSVCAGNSSCGSVLPIMSSGMFKI